jgi:hypothetical protein
MRRLNCRPGELAIVVNFFDPANIGSIVKVLVRDAKACDKKFFWRTEVDPKVRTDLMSFQVALH